MYTWGFPGGLDGKESACNAGDLDLIPRLGRSPGEGNGYPLQYSCLEKSMDREALWDTVRGIAKSQTQLSIHTGSRSAIIFSTNLAFISRYLSCALGLFLY